MMYGLRAISDLVEATKVLDELRERLTYAYVRLGDELRDLQRRGEDQKKIASLYTRLGALRTRMYDATIDRELAEIVKEAATLIEIPED